MKAYDSEYEIVEDYELIDTKMYERLKKRMHENYARAAKYWYDKVNKAIKNRQL